MVILLIFCPQAVRRGSERTDNAQLGVSKECKKKPAHHNGALATRVKGESLTSSYRVQVALAQPLVKNETDGIKKSSNRVKFYAKPFQPTLEPLVLLGKGAGWRQLVKIAYIVHPQPELLLGLDIPPIPTFAVVL
jgi:hypothetical protein